MTNEMASNKELVHRLADDVWNEGRTEAVGELLAPNFTGHGFGPGPLDREGYEGFVSEHRETFPDLTFALDDVLAEDDRVAVRWTRTGTQEQSVMGVEPTGNRISVSGMTIYQISDDGIVEAWNVRDTASMLKQLGRLPDELPA